MWSFQVQKQAGIHRIFKSLWIPACFLRVNYFGSVFRLVESKLVDEKIIRLVE